MKLNNLVIASALLCAGLANAVTVEISPAKQSQFALQLTKTLDKALRLAQSESLANRIRWQVGEYHNIEIEMAFGNGTGVKTVTQDVPEQNALWYVTTMNLMGQEQKTEALMSREDGKILRLIVNGEEKDPNADSGELEIIEQYQTKVTVKAGSFDCFYVKARQTAEGQEAQEFEVWINPVDVNLDGMLKVVIQSMFGPVTMSLTKFGKK
jgi:hypothetical protein